VAHRISASGAHPDSQVTNALERSYSSAAALAKTDPHYADQIVAGARASFLSGANWAYAAGALAIVVGAVLVAVRFPSRQTELDLLARYGQEDSSGTE